MNTLLVILIIVVLLVLILMIAAASLTADYVIEKEVVINKPKQEVFNFIKILRNQDKYNKWTMLDPNSKKEFRGTDGTVGFVYAWDSDNKQVGKGEQSIERIVDGERIDFGLHFIKPFEGNAKAVMITESVSNGGTRLKWIFSGIRNFPMKIMHLLLNLKKMLGRDLETSLANLKAYLER